MVYFLVGYIKIHVKDFRLRIGNGVNIPADKSHRAGSAGFPGQSGTCGAPR